MVSMEQTIQNLKRRGFEARLFETGRPGASAAIAIIGQRSVGFGGSVTLRDLGIFHRLRAQGNTAWFARSFSGEEVPNVYERAQNTQVFLSSANALTETGCLVNIDGRGNRVAGLAFGHEEAIVIVGKNKLVKDVPEGIRRPRATPPASTPAGWASPRPAPPICSAATAAPPSACAAACSSARARPPK